MMPICRHFVRFQSTKPIAIIRSKGKGTRYGPPTFVDIKQVKVCGGKGGDGCISLSSIFRVEFAGPDGGDGGNGGHVFFRGSHNCKSLANLASNIMGNDGERGYNENCHGKNAEPKIIDVPFGTIFKTMDGKRIGDIMTEEEKYFLAARGGAGGKGNKFFTTSTNQCPEMAEFGAQGEARNYIIELSSIAHVGLVGFPNAGKSTILQAVTRARPKIASYPFTTLRPHIGMVRYDDLEQIAIADIPGLIEEAHKNRGLGHNFLKHIQRCLMLAYVIDLSSENPIQELQTLYNEIEIFDPTMRKRPSIILANKMDLEVARANLEEFKKQIGNDIPILPISAKFGLNLKTLLSQIRELYDSELEKVVHETKTTKDEIEFLRNWSRNMMVKKDKEEFISQVEHDRFNKAERRKEIRQVRETLKNEHEFN